MQELQTVLFEQVRQFGMDVEQDTHYYNYAS